MRRRAPQRIRLVAVDLDGTALRGNGRITRATRRALRMARRHGAVVCVATGRAPTAARQYARILRANGPIVCLDGALIMQGERLLFDLPLPREAAARVTELAEEVSGGWIALTRRGRVHGGRSRRPPQASLGQVLRHPARSLRFLKSVWREEHRRSETAPDEPVYKLLIWAPAGAPRERLDREVRAVPGIRVPSAPGTTAEVVADGVTKGRALEVVATHLGIPAAEAVAFGDARNDVEMLAWAGYGVAMGGAPAELLAVADAQTEGVQQDGLAREIRRLFRGRGRAAHGQP
jgi:hypothetical protein